MTPQQRAAAMRLADAPLIERDHRWHKEAADLLRELAAEPVQEPVAWHVCSVNSDGSLSLEFAAAWEESAHEHINDAINEHDIEDAASWVVRPVYAAPQQRKPTMRRATREEKIARPGVYEVPVQDEPVAYVDPRQLARSCASLHCITRPEYRSYADAQAGLEYTPVYLHPQQQRVPLTDDQVFAALADQVFWATSRNFILRVVRDVERAHGITGEQE